MAGHPGSTLHVGAVLGMWHSKLGVQYIRSAGTEEEFKAGALSAAFDMTTISSWDPGGNFGRFSYLYAAETLLIGIQGSSSAS